MVYDIACYVRIQEAGFFSKSMSYCREEGKDKLIFVTEEDQATPSSVTLEEDDEEELEGLIKENGEINWDCPCLQGMAYGPCGEQFKGAFSCFHYSEADPKGSDCIPQFRDMQECFMKYPEIYGKDDEFDDEDDSINNKIEMEKTGDGGENIGSSEKNDSMTSNSKRDDPAVSADGSDANSTSS